MAYPISIWTLFLALGCLHSGAAQGIAFDANSLTVIAGHDLGEIRKRMTESDATVHAPQGLEHQLRLLILWQGEVDTRAPREIIVEFGNISPAPGSRRLRLASVEPEQAELFAAIWNDWLEPKLRVETKVVGNNGQFITKKSMPGTGNFALELKSEQVFIQMLNEIGEGVNRDGSAGCVFLARDLTAHEIQEQQFKSAEGSQPVVPSASTTKNHVPWLFCGYRPPRISDHELRYNARGAVGKVPVGLEGVMAGRHSKSVHHPLYLEVVPLGRTDQVTEVKMFPGTASRIRDLEPLDYTVLSLGQEGCAFENTQNTAQFRTAFLRRGPSPGAQLGFDPPKNTHLVNPVSGESWVDLLHSHPDRPKWLTRYEPPRVPVGLTVCSPSFWSTWLKYSVDPELWAVSIEP